MISMNAAVRGDRRVDLEVEHALDLLADHFLGRQGGFEPGLDERLAALDRRANRRAALLRERGPLGRAVLGDGDDRSRTTVTCAT